MLSGRLLEPMNASTIAIPPTMPEKKFGWNSSARMP